jgi:NAD(P)H-dependent FMN reductase
MAISETTVYPPSRLRVGVIAGSTRPNRKSAIIAEWLRTDNITDLELHLVDLKDANLPLLDEPVPAAFGDYQRSSTRAWSDLISTFDAFIMVTPEYNHSTSAVLKNALDHLYWEWHDKPVAFVGYGLDGGTRAVEHLRTIVAELGMAGVGPQVVIDLTADYADGRFEPRPFQSESRSRMLGQLANWAGALQTLRRRTMSTETNRMAVDDPLSHRSGAEGLAELIGDLQESIERVDPDIYDYRFADDVLWGNPFGGTLAGFHDVNSAHRWIMATNGAPPSSYEIVQMLTPLDGVTIAHVRRNDLSVATDDPFSEMALYVLVKRGGSWWLAAAQNTPIVSHPS